MWRIDSEGVFHFHDPIYLWVDAEYCPLCKEEVPNYIKLQAQLLDIKRWTDQRDRYIDFFINTGSADPDNYQGGVFFFHEEELSLEFIEDKNTQKAIIQVFNNYGIYPRQIVYPTEI